MSLSSYQSSVGQFIINAVPRAFDRLLQARASFQSVDTTPNMNSYGAQANPSRQSPGARAEADLVALASAATWFTCIDLAASGIDLDDRAFNERSVRQGSRRSRYRRSTKATHRATPSGCVTASQR
jgi:hypothetical protein